MLAPDVYMVLGYSLLVDAKWKQEVSAKALYANLIAH